ncbi:MAG: hypothetical protein EP330_12480 [Deltaproteobacteria bacterium]|nr:MAG: hypothetical protein EP330_12480 [Deltaproteobacteria bacterium]
MSRFVFLALALAGCTDGTDTDWFLFNSEEDVIEVQVTAGSETGDAVTIDLHSTTGAVVIGTAELTPGSGPVGTEHRLVVQVGDTWEEDVERVTVSADAGERGTETFLMNQDSADHGLWVLDLQSAGSEGEIRTDRLTVQLFQEQPVEEPVDTAAQ